MPAKVANWRESRARQEEEAQRRVKRREKQQAEAKRRRLAAQLWASGLTFREIAKQAGYKRHNVVQVSIRAHLREVRAGCATNDERAELERERLLLRNEGLVRELLLVGRKTDDVEANDETRIRAIAEIRKLDERRAKLLGADAPTRQEVAGPGGTPLAVEFREIEEIREAVFSLIAERPELRDVIAAKLDGEGPTNGRALPAPTNGTA